MMRLRPAIPRLRPVLLAALAALPAAVCPSAADVVRPDFTVTGIRGPNVLQAGLSGTYTVTVRNVGNKTAYLELFMIFAGRLDQTGHIQAGGAFACEVRHDSGINAAVRCTGGQLGPNDDATFVVQGRGNAPGKGILMASINPSQSIPEHDHDNNTRQLDIAIK